MDESGDFRRWHDSCICGTWRIHMSDMWVTSWMRHATHMKTSCHIYRWVIPYIWKCHVTHMDESCHVYERVTLPIWMRHVTYMQGSCLIVYDMAHSYAWHHPLICATLLIHMCGMTHSYMVMSYTPGVYEASVCDLQMTHVTHIHASYHTYECNIRRTRTALMNEPLHTYGWVMSNIWMSQVAHIQAPYRTYECDRRTRHMTTMNDSL